MKRLFLSLMLVLTVFVSCFAVQAEIIDSGSCGESVLWSFDSNGTLTLSGEGGTDNYYVVATPPWAEYKNQITSLVVEAGVTYLNGGVFMNCESLKNVTLADTVTSLSTNTFANCYALERIALPDEMTYISVGAFAGCRSLKEVKFPQKLEGIGTFAFNYCSALEKAELPYGTQSISTHAFMNCTSLNTVIIPETVTSIGNGAFYGANNLKICGTAGSYAETYASENGYTFEAVEIVKPVEISKVGSENITEFTPDGNKKTSENSDNNATAFIIIAIVCVVIIAVAVVSIVIVKKKTGKRQ